MPRSLQLGNYYRYKYGLCRDSVSNYHVGKDVRRQEELTG